MPRRLKRRLNPFRFRGVFVVQVAEGHSFKINSQGSRIENDLYWRGYGQGWEGMSLQLWRDLVPHSTVICDVGASDGVYALAAKALNPSAVVAAFEPQDPAFKLLEENVELNGFKIIADPRAVSDATGTATMYDVVSQHGMSSLETRTDMETVEVPVRTVRLDDFANENALTTIDLIKLDIEGHEPAAIRGLGKHLAMSRPPILVEILSDSSGSEIWKLLQPLGYEAYRIADRTGVQWTEAVGWVSNQERNYLLAVPQMLERAGLSGLVRTGRMDRARA